MVFAGMNGYTGMYRSPSGKENWSQMNDGLIVYRGISSYNVRVYAIGAVGATLVTGTGEGIYYSENNGQHWDSAGGTMGACSFAAGDGVIFAAAKTQGVLSSSDDGRTWKSVNTGLNGLNVISMTAEGKNVFASGAGGRVSFTSNLGASWTPIDSGLPAADVLCLALKGQTLFAGCAGKGVWRLALTGSTPALSERAPFGAEPRARLCMRPGASPRLQVSYYAAHEERLSIALYGVRGEKIATLFSGATGPGNHVRTFDLKSRPSGTSIARIRIGAQSVSRRIVAAR
jgi:ligand-binding sensor domain-containing protein